MKPIYETERGRNTRETTFKRPALYPGRCRWEMPDGSVCPNTWQASSKSRKYCDLHRPIAEMQQQERRTSRRQKAKAKYEE